MRTQVCMPPGEPLMDEYGAEGDRLELAQAQASRCLKANICTWCEVCQLLCPDQCITRDTQTGHIVIDLEHCKGCGLCAAFCPKGAIQMEREI